MAPKKKAYPVDLGQTVIKHYLNGDSEHEIAQKLIIPRTSVHYIIDKYKKTKCVHYGPSLVKTRLVKPLL